MTADLIGDREKLADAEKRIRAGLLAFAAYLTGRGTSEQVLAALCPADVDAGVRSSSFLELLHIVDTGAAPLPHAAEVDLDYMTGGRR